MPFTARCQLPHVQTKPMIIAIINLADEGMICENLISTYYLFLI